MRPRHRTSSACYPSRCLPILVTPFIANARGHEPGWAVLVPIGVVFVAALAVLVLLRLVTASAGPGHRGLRN
ncbi:MAG: hypothetical protein DLM61_06965 [Pseudonocardiales bacterium]|nr:MAG: hypothetical protein DLM61_06965 [Pseudonocardiales bacterium]